MKALLKKLLQKITNALPRRLPITDEAMVALISLAIERAGLDPSNPSLRNALASTMFQGPAEARLVTLNQLIAVINTARTKQAAYNVIEAVRLEEKARYDAGKLAAKAADAADAKAE